MIRIAALRRSILAWILATGAAGGCGSSLGGDARGLDAGGEGGSRAGSTALTASTTTRATPTSATPTSATTPSGAGSSGGGSSVASSGSGTSDAASTEAGAPAGLWVTGYYPSWNDDANSATYPVRAIDWAGLSEVASAFYIPDGNGGWASGSFDAATANALIAAAHGTSKRAIASIGGADSGAGFEGSMANLSTFMSNLAALLTLGYDGIDIDWEGGNQTLAEDQALETTLLQGLRAAHPSILLTMTAGIVNPNLAQASDYAFYGAIAPALDRINVMTYGMAGAYEGWESWHSSPLHWNNVSATPSGIDNSVSYYLAAGVPAAKLGVGIGFYGLCYTAPVTGPVQPLDGSTVVVSDDVMSYANILANYYSSSAYHYDTDASVPYLTLSGNDAEPCTYVTYEDATSIAAKAAWVKAQGLGGVIIWSIDEGYVAGGASLAEQNPLLDVTKSSFLQ